MVPKDSQIKVKLIPFRPKRSMANLFKHLVNKIDEIANEATEAVLELRGSPKSSDERKDSPSRTSVRNHFHCARVKWI